MDCVQCVAVLGLFLLSSFLFIVALASTDVSVCLCSELNSFLQVHFFFPDNLFCTRFIVQFRCCLNTNYPCFSLCVSYRLPEKDKKSPLRHPECSQNIETGNLFTLIQFIQFNSFVYLNLFTGNGQNQKGYYNCLLVFGVKVSFNVCCWC